MDQAAHAENYGRESAQKTMTVAELHKELGGIIAAGGGDLPVFRMHCDGLTHAVPVKMCFKAEPYDGALVWIIADR